METLADRHGSDATCRHPRLSDELQELIRSGELRQTSLGAELRGLEQSYGNEVYSELIHLLSHLRFEPDVARDHWKSIREHQESMGARLGEPVDVRVAMASYFMHVEQLLTNPKIIEWQAYERTRSSAYQDELTQLRNYRCFSEFLPQEIARSEQYNAPLSLVLFDVDNFKHYNDRYGHEAGNTALREIGRLLAHHTRKSDLPARYGGEEFAVILPSTPKAGTVGVAERIRDAVERHAFPIENGAARLTVSVGVAVCPADATTADELVRRADGAMYEAKADGKNRVRFYGDSLRSYARIDQALEGTFSSDGKKRHSLRTINLSVGGTLFWTQAEVYPGELIDVQLELPDGRRVIPVSARVVSVEKQTSQVFLVATRTIEMNPADRWAFIESLRQQDTAVPQH